MTNCSFGIKQQSLTYFKQVEKNEQDFYRLSTVPFWRDKNVKDILVHSKHNLQFYDQTDGYRNCEYNKCALFKYLIKGSVQ